MVVRIVKRRASESGHLTRINLNCVDIGLATHEVRRTSRLRVVIRVKFPTPGRRNSATHIHAQAIQGPWQTQARTAVLCPWFRVNGARVFFEVSLQILRRHQPDVLAGPADAIRKMAHLVLQEGGAVPLPEYGILVFTGDSAPQMTEADRDLFWRAFQVPVFEQYRDKQGELVAAECEAHQGLHIVARNTPFNVGSLRIIDEPCSCGTKTPRLVPAKQERFKVMKAAAAAG